MVVVSNRRIALKRSTTEEANGSARIWGVNALAALNGAIDTFDHVKAIAIVQGSVE